MNDTKLTPAPLATPTATTPPGPEDVVPRTEHFEWLMVWPVPPDELANPPSATLIENHPAMLVQIARPADVAHGVRRFIERTIACHLYPTIWVAPDVAGAFRAQTAAVEDFGIEPTLVPLGEGDDHWMPARRYGELYYTTASGRALTADKAVSKREQDFLKQLVEFLNTKHHARLSLKAVMEWYVKWTRDPWVPQQVPTTKTPRPAAQRAMALVENSVVEQAAFTAYRLFQSQAIKPTAKQIVAAMRAAGAKRRERVLRDAYKAVEDNPDDWGL